MKKKKQISDYPDLKQVAVVLHPEDQLKLKEIKKAIFRYQGNIVKITTATILRHCLQKLDIEKIF